MKKVLTIVFSAVFVFAAVSAYACGNDNCSSANAKSGTKAKQVQASVKTEAKVQTAQAKDYLSNSCSAKAAKTSTASVNENIDNTAPKDASVKTAGYTCSASAACPTPCNKESKNAKAATAETKAAPSAKSASAKDKADAISR
ncbi:MAG: hypothetical protein GY839_16815 [candidate division Zixibacteria bacterium]|nr:hypothetical protein [candidate division Zixibacteria bacterium]